MSFRILRPLKQSSTFVEGHRKLLSREKILKMEALFAYSSLPAFLLSWFVGMVVGMIWYSKSLFCNLCGKLAFGNDTPMKANPKAIAISMIGNLVAFSYFSFLLGAVGCKTGFEGALWGLAFGLFFDSGINVPHTFFEDRPFGLFLIHRGCHAISLTVAGAVLGTLCGGN